MDALVSSGSLAVVFAWLLVAGLGVPLPEEPALLAAGVLAFHGSASPIAVLAVALAGVIAGDLGLFLLARRIGPAMYGSALLRRVLPPARRARVEAAYARHGGKLVFLARHVAGVRAATIALAGVHRMAVRRFLAWDALAASVSVPLMVGLGYLCADHVDRVRAGVAEARHYIVLAAVLGAGGYLAVRWAITRRRWRDRCTPRCR